MNEAEQLDVTVRNQLNEDFEGINFSGFPVFGGNRARRIRHGHIAQTIVSLVNSAEVATGDMLQRIHNRRTRTAPALGEQLLTALGETQRQQTLPPPQTQTHESV